MGIHTSRIDRSPMQHLSELTFEGSLDVQIPTKFDNAERSFSYDEQD